MAAGVSARLSPAEGRRFGLTIGAAFLALAGLLAWRGHGSKASVFAIVALALIAAGLVIPTRLGPVYRGWMALAAAMSRVTTPLFMGLVYFAILTPTALVRRLFGCNQLVRPRSARTFWITREPAVQRRTDMHRQF